MRFIKALGRFWYDFIIGDDWKIAVGVLLALATTAGVMAGIHSGTGSLSMWNLLGAVLVLVFFVVSLLIDTRPKRAKS
jgi:hypothetical protein